jgi:shikimate dehydrogenase
MTIYGLIGRKLGHSFSAEYFNKKFENENINARYLNFEIETVKEIREITGKTPELKGLNVTIPYKEEIVAFLDAASPAVKDTGACNTIKIESGRLYGFNTDVEGFEKSLTTFTGNEKMPALVLGTGGASKAVCYVLRHHGIDFKTVSRNRMKGDLTYAELTPEIIENHRLIINTTPLGMSPYTGLCPALPYDAITKNHYAFDLIYNPEETLFLKKFRSRGAKTKNGLQMLYTQAEAAWRIWK